MLGTNPESTIVGETDLGDDADRSRAALVTRSGGLI
jgi:hypothetical protein